MLQKPGRLYRSYIHPNGVPYSDLPRHGVSHLPPELLQNLQIGQGRRLVRLALRSRSRQYEEQDNDYCPQVVLAGCLSFERVPVWPKKNAKWNSISPDPTPKNQSNVVKLSVIFKIAASDA